MRQELKNIEYIENYLEGSLSKLDKHKFEHHMRENKEFESAVELQKQITEQLKEEAFLNDVSVYKKTFIDPSDNPSIFKTKGFWFTIPPFLLLIALLLLWNNNKSENNLNVEINPTSEIINTETETEIIDKNLSPANTNAFQTAYISKNLPAGNDAVIQLKGSNSVLHIPANSLVDQQGNPVRGSYQIQYRQIKDKAAMAFSGIPMNFNDDQENFNFSAAGIFEVRAFKNDEELKVAPGKKLSLDFEADKRKSGMNLYYFDEQTENWKVTDEKIRFPKRGAYEEKFDSISFKKDVEEFIKKEELKNNGPERDSNKINVGITSLMPEGIEKAEEDKGPDPGNYLVRHFYNPRMIKELSLRSFGAYNLSEVYKVENQIAVDAEYRDEFKKLIDDAHMLTVIDMNYNAAYSFKPDEFICNSKANNVFLLWTSKGKIFSFVKRSTVKMKTGSYSFTMEDLSNEIESIADLKRYLRFVAKKTRKTVTKIK